MTPPQVLLLSLWQSDAERQLDARARHLLAKTYPHLYWLWIVADSTDATAKRLRALTRKQPRAQVVDFGPIGPLGGDPMTRMARLSRTVTRALECVALDDEHVIIHESDLTSPPDVVERLLDGPAACTGTWPVLRGPGIDQLYDTWALRGLDGQHFSSHPPYHPDYRADAPFEVLSFGSVYGFPAAAVRRGLPCTTRGCLDLCDGLRAQGYTLWVDPALEVVQPTDLWTPAAWPPTGVAV